MFYLFIYLLIYLIIYYLFWMFYLFIYLFIVIINPFMSGVPQKGHWQSVLPMFRLRRTRRVIWVYTVCITYF